MPCLAVLLLAVCPDVPGLPDPDGPHALPVGRHPGRNQSVRAVIVTVHPHRPHPTPPSPSTPLRWAPPSLLRPSTPRRPAPSTSPPSLPGRSTPPPDSAPSTAIDGGGASARHGLSRPPKHYTPGPAAQQPLRPSAFERVCALGWCDYHDFSSNSTFSISSSCIVLW